VDDTDMRDGFYAALEAAGLSHLREQDDPIVFHDLRHTFGTLAVQVWPVTAASPDDHPNSAVAPSRHSPRSSSNPFERRLEWGIVLTRPRCFDLNPAPA
jgi:integrase